MAAQEAGALERPLWRQNLGVFPQPVALASAALPASLKNIEIVL